VTIGVGGRLRLGFRARDATGGDVPDRTAVWTTSNPSVTTVSPEDADAHGDGIVIGAGAGTATISATTDGVTGTAQVTVAPLQFTSVSVGSYMSCGLTPAGEAFCWGVPGGLGTGDFNGQTTPVSVAGGLLFDQISVGQQHACGLTSAGAVYCWGDDSSGQLGAGSSPSPACAPFQNSIAFCPAPVAVSGGLAFKSVSAGTLHTCGLLMDGTAYCWGYNARNQLGATTTETCSSYPCSGVPVLVSGGLKFAEISAGYLHTCALSLDQAAYCWGDNNRGEGGNGVSSGSSGTPTAVVGGLTFTSIDAGFQLTCGIVTGGLGYCWGDNEYRQLGSGTPSTNEDTPTPIFGGMTFAKLTAGARAACGVTPAGAGYCWGQNSQGTLGTGDFSDRPLPTPIVGGLTFASIDVGNSLTTCGLTVAQAAYCWGRAAQGTTGTIAPPSYLPTPTRVAGQP
jgi:alpha-tubulin suppressor-like RCC1 family protein